MNLYDKENRIIERFQEIGLFKIRLEPFNYNNIVVFNSIYWKRNWGKWIDTSSKNDLPPDFYNDKLKLMMDVMRIDDHSFVDKNDRVVNLHNKRESELVKELISKNDSIREVAEKGNLYINPKHDKFGEDDHNYDLYIKNFERIISKHISKIKNYKSNHPNYKVIFFIFDESTSYIKCLDYNRPKAPGDLFYGELHL